MKYSIGPLFATAALLAGCVSLSVPGGFSPVQGPLSQQSPLPTYTAKMSGLLSGTITVTLANGEVCRGPWAFVSKPPPDDASKSGAASHSPDMAADWDLVYGTGFYTAHVVGNKLYARATLTGNIGSIVYVELSNETNTRGNTKGVAQDNLGNVFKVSVYN
ncbi:MAG: hypothetical protein WA642_14815 [Steroidobacteraceae bacterium]